MPFLDVRPKRTESSQHGTQPRKPFTAYRGLKTIQQLRKSTAQNQIDAECPRSRILNDVPDARPRRGGRSHRNRGSYRGLALKRLASAAHARSPAADPQTRRPRARFPSPPVCSVRGKVLCRSDYLYILILSGLSPCSSPQTKLGAPTPGLQGKRGERIVLTAGDGSDGSPGAQLWPKAPIPLA